MKRLILPLFIFHFCSAYGQQWIEPSATWYFSLNSFAPLGSVIVHVEHDTIVEGHLCNVLYLKNHEWTTSKTITNTLYTFKAFDTIYFFVGGKFRPTVDLKASVGDTIKIFTKDSYPNDQCYRTDSVQPYVVDSVFTLSLDTFHLKTFRFKRANVNIGFSYPNKLQFSEKIGFWNYPYPILECNTDPLYSYLCNYGDSTITDFWMNPNITACETVGIEDRDFYSYAAFSISPNPSSTLFALILEYFPSSPFDVQLLNVHGQLVKTIHIDNQKTEISCADLPEGIYFLKSENSSPSKVMVLH